MWSKKLIYKWWERASIQHMAINEFNRMEEHIWITKKKRDEMEEKKELVHDDVIGNNQMIETHYYVYFFLLIISFEKWY